MVVVLLGVIGGGVAMFYGSIFAGGSDAKTRRELPMHFVCNKCGHEFTLSKEEFNLQHKDVEDPRGSHAGKANCPNPKCGGKFCSKLQSTCPLCKALVGKAVPGQGKDRGKLVCPECKGVVGRSRPRG